MVSFAPIMHVVLNTVVFVVLDTCFKTTEEHTSN